tara:strand:+ start:362 stop:733 length:372 start_codon:yes stop_codon:yes gene_type:complete
MQRIKLELVIETEDDEWILDWISKHKDEIINLKMNNKKIEEYPLSKEEIQRLKEWFDCMDIFIEKHPENGPINAFLKQMPRTKEGKKAATVLLNTHHVLIMGSAWPRKYGGNWPPIHKGSEEE